MSYCYTSTRDAGAIETIKGFLDIQAAFISSGYCGFFWAFGIRVLVYTTCEHILVNGIDSAEEKY